MKYQVKGPDGQIHEIEGPEGATPDQVIAAAKQMIPAAKTQSGSQPGSREASRDVPAEPSAMQTAASIAKFAGPHGELLLGGLRGAKDVIDTGAQWLSSGVDKLTGGSEGARVRAMNEAGDKDFAQAADGNLNLQIGRIGGQAVATAPVGGVIANGLARVPGVAAAAPNVLNAIRSSGMSAGEGNLLTRAIGGGITGGASTALVSPEHAGTGAAIGAVLPPSVAAAGAAGRKVANALASSVSPEVKALAGRAEELGIQIPADRIANSKPLNAAAASLNYVPFSGRAGVERRMQDQLDTALSRTFGQDSPNVTASLRKAQTELGGKFDQTLQSNTLTVDKQLMSDIGTVSESASKELGPDGLRAINGQIDELMAKAANGEIDGQAAYNIKKTLDRIGQRSTPEAYHARELKKALMGALDRSLGPEEAKAFAKTRKEYGNMLALEGLATNGAEGGLSMARVANMKNINNADLQELADIAAQFLKPREGMHGAAQRAGVGAIVAGFGGLPALAGGAAVGRTANALLDSNAMRGAVLRDPATINALARPNGPRPLLGAAPVVLGRDQ